MAKFKVHVQQTGTRTGTVEASVTRDEVVEAYELVGEERACWREYVDQYLGDNPEQIVERIEAGEARWDDGDEALGWSLDEPQIEDVEDA